MRYMGLRKYPWLITILGLIFFWKILINPGKMIYWSFSDITLYHSPMKFIIHRAFNTQGTVPLWNPYIFGGTSLAANPQAGLFYPLNIFFLFSSPDQLFGYLAVLHIILGGLAMYLLARNIGLEKYPSFISALVFMFSGQLISYIYEGHFIFLNAVWIPLAFLAYDKAIINQDIKYASITGAILALQLFSGGIQLVFYTVILLFLWTLYNMKKKGLYILAVALLIFLGLSAIQAVPTYELLENSRRGIGFSDPMSYSQPLSHIIGLVMPYFYGNIFQYWGGGDFLGIFGYAGIIPLVIAAFSLCARKNRYVRFFIFLSIFAIVLAFGGPLREVIYRLPGFNSFRAHGRILLLHTFSISILAGFGSKELVRRIRVGGARGDALKICFALSIFLLAYILIYYKYTKLAMEKDLLLNIFLFYFLILSFVLAATVFSKYPHKTRLFKAVLVLLIIYNLWLYGMPLINVGDPATIYRGNELLDFLSANAGSNRVYATNYHDLPQQITMRRGIQSLGGVLEPFILNRYSTFMEAAGNYTFEGVSNSIPPWQVYSQRKTYPVAGLLGILNTRYVITRYPLDNPDFLLAERFNSTYVYENLRFLPRAFVVHEAVYASDGSEALSLIQTMDPASVVVLETDIWLKLAPPIYNETVTIFSYTPNEIVVHANLSNPGVLVLSEMWYPGWKAYDNGRETDVLRADYTLRGVYLDEGIHEVRFIYHPASLKFGALVSVVTLLLIFYIGREALQLRG